MRQVTITPHQVKTTLKRQSEGLKTPEEKLWMAVLETTADDVQLRAERALVLDFLRSDWFSEVCGYAGVDPDTARGLIMMTGQKKMIREAL